MKKIWDTLKTAAENFSIGAGLAAFALGIIAIFVFISLPLSLLIIAIIGVAFSIVGTWYAVKEKKKKEQRDQQKEQEKIELQEDNARLLQLTQTMKRDLDEIKREIEKHHQQLTKNADEENLQKLAKAQAKANHAYKKFERLRKKIKAGSTLSLFNVVPEGEDQPTFRGEQGGEKDRHGMEG